MNKGKNSTLILILSSVILAIFLRVLILGVYKVPTVTMSPTLIEGDVVVSNKLFFSFMHNQPERGDVVVFTLPQKLGQYFIKRVVAIPGDTLEIKNGILVINNKPCEYHDIQGEESFKVVNEICLNSERQIIRMLSDELKAANVEAMTLKEGEYFVLGDHRDASEDSRQWGVIKYDQLSSKVELVWMSIGSTQDSISHEKGFRFSRFLTKVK